MGSTQCLISFVVYLIHQWVTFNGLGDIWWWGHTAIAKVEFTVREGLSLEDFPVYLLSGFVITQDEGGRAIDVGIEPLMGWVILCWCWHTVFHSGRYSAFCSRVLSMAVWLYMCGLYNWRKLHIPWNDCSVMMLFGAHMSRIPWILALSRLTSVLVNWHPYNVRLGFKISHLDEFKARLFFGCQSHEVQMFGLVVLLILDVTATSL